VIFSDRNIFRVPPWLNPEVRSDVRYNCTGKCKRTAKF